jgi:hypothetical protein
MLVIVWAGNDEREFILKAKHFAIRQFPEAKVIVRNADAYNPRQHIAADAIVASATREELIRCYEEHGTQVFAVDPSADVPVERAPAPPTEPANAADFPALAEELASGEALLGAMTPVREEAPPMSVTETAAEAPVAEAAAEAPVAEAAAEAPVRSKRSK